MWHKDPVNCLFALIGGCLVVLAVVVATIVIPMIGAEQEKTFNNGYEAYKVGVPAEANPEKDTSYRRKWLEGWIKGKKEDK